MNESIEMFKYRNHTFNIQYDKYGNKNLIDSRRNTASILMFETLEKCAIALLSCKNCTDCHNCENCDKCNDCIYCLDCDKCNLCINCSNCTNGDSLKNHDNEQENK